MRTLAIVLPHLPIEVVLRASPDLARGGRPVALVEARGGSLHVVAASRAALELGVQVGSTHANALAVAPDLVVRDRLPEEERAALRALARWASLALSPRSAVDDARRAVLVDVKGIDHVHGSEALLLERALGDLRAFGYEVRGAIADTPLGALALAEFHRAGPSVIAEPGRTLEALLPLPPRALALDETALKRLAAVGVETIEQLVALPRRTLPARLGEAVLERLDRALGVRPDVLVAEPLPETVHERLLLEGGTDSIEALALALEDLARRTLAVLAACSRAASGVELSFLHEDGAPTRFEVRLASPITQARALLGVLRERLDRLDLGRPVVAVDLRVLDAALVVEKQGDLFSPRDAGEAEDLACLIGRLEGRLGARHVCRAELVAEHRPERAVNWQPADNALAPDPAALAPGRRPTRLLESPRPLEPEQVARLRRVLGPERIETGFWDGAEVRRDYWIVADEAFRESWIFEDLDSGRWFLHGVFD